MFVLPVHEATVTEYRDSIFNLLMSLGIDSRESVPPAYVTRARIFKLLRSPRIDSKEPIAPGCVAWRARCNNPTPSQFLASMNCLKIPAQAGRYDNPIPTRFLALADCSKKQQESKRCKLNSQGTALFLY